MKKFLPLALALTAALTLGACSKKADPAAATAAKAASAAAGASGAASGAQQVRKATYDPNLKPANIVWDSPEKKRAWEERQAQIAAQRGGQAHAPAASQAPAQR